MSQKLFRFAIRLSKEKSVIKLLCGRELSLSHKIRPLSTSLLVPLAVRTDVQRYYGKHVKEHVKDKRHKYDSDSDSDMESLGHRGDTIFWRQKMRTFHALLDVNKDGVISFEDFSLLADRFIKLGNLSEKQTAEFKKIIKDLWVQQFGEINPYNLITVEQYLEIMHNVLNDKRRVNHVHGFLPYLFKAVDNDASGEISIAEFKLFFKCLGLESEDAKTAFVSMDSNNNGKVTLKEFVGHGKDFFLTEDEERVSKYFWGPLVDH